MTRLMIRAAAVALCAAALAACETAPQYATRTGYTPPPPLVQEKPQYPIRAQPAQPAPAAAAATGEDAVAARPSASVESQAIAPSAPAARRELAQAPPAPAPAAEAPPTPASERAGELERMPSAAPSSPAPPTAAPPTAAQPSQPAYHVIPPQSTYATPARPAPARPAAPRFAADGKVVSGEGVFFDYEVSRGDHVDALAREYHTTRGVIVSANHLRAPYGVHPGQILKMPVAKAYIVQDGDTLAQVAKRFSVSPVEIAELNHISTRSTLRAGEKLGLPPSFVDRGPIRLPPSAVAEAAPPSAASPGPHPYAPPARPVETTPGASTQGSAYSRPPASPPPTSPQAYVPPAVASQSYAPPPVASQSYAPPTTAQPYRPAPTAPTAPPRPPAAASAPTPSDTEIANAGRGRFVWPVRGPIVSTFGDKGVSRRNDGVDIQAPAGSSVHAAAAGYVVYAGNQVPELGNLVVLKHSDGWVTAYAHLDRISVKNQDMVVQGQELGQVGVPVGNALAQLYFQVRYTTSPDVTPKPVDPMLVLPK